MEDLTCIYLIRHSEQLKIKNRIVKNEESQISNEKIILSVDGERKAYEISQLKELNRIDVLWSSNYTRAISTAKYIAIQNNIEINIDESFNERKCGDLKSLEELGKIKKDSFTTEQLLDGQLKNMGGENRIEVMHRMEKAFKRVFSENIGKNIAIVSHGAAIKFLLMKWCELNRDNQLEYKGKMINLNSPGILKLLFKGERLIQLVQIV